MGQYRFDFGSLLPYASAFGHGVIVTLEIAVLSSLVGSLLGIPWALMLRARFIKLPATWTADAIRAIPNLVLILFFYYFPYRELLGLSPASGFVASVIALTVAQGAYSADLIRAALDQVPRTQLIGIQGLGFTPLATVRHVVLPSVVRQVLPGHVALWIGNVKLSSLASVVAVQDVVYVARVAMSQNFRSLESWIVVACIYISIVLPLTFLARYLERVPWIKRQ